MFLGQSPRPGAGGEIFERLRLTDSHERVAHHRLDDLERTQRDTAVLRNPKAKILAKFGLEDSSAFFLLHDEADSLVVETDIAAQFRERLRPHLPGSCPGKRAEQSFRVLR